MRTLRLVARRLLARPVGLALRLSARKTGLVLVYHAIAERQGDPARELVPPHSLEAFERQLRLLTARYRVVPASELLQAIESRRRGRRIPVAVTFDDDLASHAELAAPVLRRLAVPATFFLTGATLDEPRAFWWQKLQAACDLGLDVARPGADIHARAAAIEALPPEERERLAADLPAAVHGAVEWGNLSRRQLGELAGDGLEVGFHTLRHDRMPDLDDDELARALRDGRGELEAAAGQGLDAIAYPHGKADERVGDAARAAGFRLGFTGRYEAVSPAADPLLLGRVEPTFGPAADFAAPLVGVLLRGAQP
jgi:peptidoglycan/xylan/chitin deacetylase (PgdA/CDA1 family)